MIKIFILSFFFSIILYSQQDSVLNKQDSTLNPIKNINLKPVENYTDSSNKVKNLVTIGTVEYGVKIDSLPIWKIDAAMNLIGNLQEKFDYFPLQKRLELIDSINKIGIKNPTKYIYDSLKINWIFLKEQL